MSLVEVLRYEPNRKKGVGQTQPEMGLGTGQLGPNLRSKDGGGGGDDDDDHDDDILKQQIDVLSYVKKNSSDVSENDF